MILLFYVTFEFYKFIYIYIYYSLIPTCGFINFYQYKFRLFRGLHLLKDSFIYNMTLTSLSYYNNINSCDFSL